MDENKIYSELEKLINKAIKKNEVPVAALIIENNKIIGKGYNKVEKNNNFMCHAEILAINNAIKHKKNWRLDNCILYTTLEPCPMCKEIIKKSRIKKVIYFSKQKNMNQLNSKIEYLYNEKSFFSKTLTTFFQNIRN